MGENQACDNSNAIINETWGTVCIGVLKNTILVVLLIIMVFFLFTSPSYVLYSHQDIYDRYGTSLVVTDVTSVAGGKENQWVAQCSSSEDVSDEERILILKPASTKIAAPEEGMTISYTINQSDLMVEVEEGEYPEVFVSDWNEQPKQRNAQ